jgi:hypothetical protein
MAVLENKNGVVGHAPQIAGMHENAVVHYVDKPPLACPVDPVMQAACHEKALQKPETRSIAVRKRGCAHQIRCG